MASETTQHCKLLPIDESVVTFRWDDLPLEQYSSALEAIREYVIHDKLWSELGTQIQFESFTASEDNAILLTFLLQSEHSRDGVVDIRDVGIPVQTPIVYVQAIEVELLLSGFDMSTGLLHTPKRSGVFTENEAQYSRHDAIDQACASLLVEALAFFFNPGFGPGLHYIRQRMFQAPRLSDLAPGVFVPQFSRDLLARQRLITPLCRILSEFESLEKEESTGSPSCQEDSSAAISALEIKTWNCMIHALRSSSKAVKYNRESSRLEEAEQSVNSMQKFIADGSHCQTQPSEFGPVPRHSDIKDLLHASTRKDGAFKEHDATSLSEYQANDFGGVFGSREDSSHLFDFDFCDADRAQCADDELLLQTDVSDEDTAMDDLFLDTEMELCHRRGEGFSGFQAGHESCILNQQVAFFDLDKRPGDSVNYQDHEMLIGQDLITHSSVYANPPCGERFHKTEDHVQIVEHPSLSKWPPDTSSVLINRNNSQCPAAISRNQNISSQHLKTPSRASQPTTEPAMFDKMHPQQRRESINPIYTGKWCLGKSKTAPVVAMQGHPKTPSRSISVKSQTTLSPQTSITRNSDGMLFDSFSFGGFTPRSSPRSRSDTDEMLFKSPSQESTAPSSRASSPSVQPRRKSSVLRKLKTGSETWSMSDDEIVFQQRSPIRDVQIKERKRMENSQEK